jgi:hypothetical protein
MDIKEQILSRFENTESGGMGGGRSGLTKREKIMLHIAINVASKNQPAEGNQPLTDTASALLQVVGDYLRKYPSVRFAQALFSLNINQFADEKAPEQKQHLLRDIYNDKDEDILGRIPVK